jgi:uncharacterized ferredoxin-like protein
VGVGVNVAVYGGVIVGVGVAANGSTGTGCGVCGMGTTPGISYSRQNGVGVGVGVNVGVKVAVAIWSPCAVGSQAPMNRERNARTRNRVREVVALVFRMIALPSCQMY